MNEQDIQHKKDPQLYVDTGAMYAEVNEVILIIENDKELSERNDKLKERIAKGVTRCNTYYERYVEQNLLIKLVDDTIFKYDLCTRVRHRPIIGRLVFDTDCYQDINRVYLKKAITEYRNKEKLRCQQESLRYKIKKNINEK